MSLITTKISSNLNALAAYVAHFLLTTDRQESRAVKTIQLRTDGINLSIVYNPDYVNSLSDEEKVGLLIHNILHIIYKHITRYKVSYDKSMFDIAADIIVNQQVEQGGVKYIPKDSAKISDFPHFNLKKGETLDYYYKTLYTELTKLPKPDESDGQGGNDGSTGQGDSNEDKSDNKGDDDNNNGNNQSNLNSSQQRLKDLYNQENLNDWVKEEGTDEAMLEFNIDNRILGSYESLVRTRGTIPGFFTDMVNLIIKARTPVIDWKKQLKMFLSSSNVTKIKTTVKKVSKRFGTTPGIKIQRKTKIMVAVDTSGSVSIEDFEEFFSELKNIHKANKDILIVECDAAVGNVYNYNGKTPTKLSGRGGTSFQPVVDYINGGKYRPDCLIYFTDGYCTPPQSLHVPTVWVLCSKGAEAGALIKAKFPGKVVKMTLQDAPK